MANYPKVDVQSVEVGSTTLTSPVLFLEVGSKVYAGGYIQQYNLSFRRIFPSFEPSTGKIYLNAYSIAAGATIPETTFTNMKVLVASNG